MRRDAVPLGSPVSPMAATGPALAWREAAWPVVFALVWILAWYWSTGMRMAGIWSRSETFAHGFIVPPVVLWLIWRERAALRSVMPRPELWWLLPLAAAGLAWMVAQLTAVNAVSQFALTALLVLAVPAILGIEVARRLAFPLGFLFFAVPIGEFMLPKLMQWTADFTVSALRLTGIPVYREGLQFVIPSGAWSIVEACSGVRYLIASLMVGTLYAYLSFHSLRKRLLFVGAAIAIPIVANWMRAYMIVMIGHLSSNRLAVGVDHLIYGWLFFGVVMLAMFMVGARFRENVESKPATASLESMANAAAPPRAAFLRAAAAVAIVTALWPLLFQAIERSDRASLPTLHELANANGWTARVDPLTSWEPHIQGASATLHQDFTRGARYVALYVAYFRHQDYESKLVSSENVLVATNNREWTRIGGGTREVLLDGRQVEARYEELRGPDLRRWIAVRWYWIDGRLTSDDYAAKLYTLLSRLGGRGDDGAVVVMYAPKDDALGPDNVIDAFARDMGAPLDAMLDQTRGRR
jgi:exosortase A